MLYYSFYHDFVLFQFENELITQLDKLIEQGRGDVQYKELFYSM